MVILITGATGGIGENIAKSLTQNHQVIAIARGQKQLDFLHKKLNNPNLTVVAVDVAKPNEVENLFKSLKSLDVLINCAAILKPVGNFLDNDLELWKSNIETNLLGTVYACFYAMPKLLKSRRGKIINFAGGGSAYARPGHTAYGTSKTGVVRFTETLAVEYPGLDINVIAPGAYKTKLWQDETYDSEPREWGDIKRLQKFIDYLISQKSDGISGKFIHYKNNWENFNPQTLTKDIYTLRRVEK